MLRVAILGCENSHADTFMNLVINEKLVPDVEFVGVYSDDAEACKKLYDKYGVPVMKSYDELVGKTDGLIITARHGDNHYKYAKPYIKSGIPMFIDKPITISENEAISFMSELRDNGVKICGGSCVALEEHVRKLKQAVKDNEYGKTFGGFLRAPVNMDNPYGEFFFYAQHLIQVLCEIFGYYPNTVTAHKNGICTNCTVSYDEFDVFCQFTDRVYKYSATISCENGISGGEYELKDCFAKEFLEFYDLLLGKAQKHTYNDFIAPVFIMNAIYRSMQKGSIEKVVRPENV